MLYYGEDIEFAYGLIPVKFLKDFRLRGEIAWGEIQLPEKNYYMGLMKYGTRRSGYYAELSYRPLPWLILKYREGYLNSDSRFKNEGDLLIHEPSVRLIFGPVQLDLAAQFHQFRTITATQETPDRSYTYARLFFRY
jgi:hypothetical protein